MVSGGKETLSFEFIRILLRSQRARGLAARFASCWPVEGVNFVAAVAECGHSIGAVAAPNALKRTNSPRCLVQRNGRRCSPFSLRKLQRLVHPKAERRTSPDRASCVGALLVPHSSRRMHAPAPVLPMPLTLNASDVYSRRVSAGGGLQFY